MAKKKQKFRKKRAPNKLPGTSALIHLYQKIVRPFLNRYTLHEEQRELKEGIEGFFGLPQRRVVWCEVIEPFTMPGVMWITPSHPLKLIGGTGRRYAKRGDDFVLRLDEHRPDHNEIEFDEQVFVLTDAELDAISHKYKPRA